jgi:hypothetical protein
MKTELREEGTTSKTEKDMGNLLKMKCRGTGCESGR